MYIEIANFKYGLDARRSILSTVPGALTKLENAHITQGGEIEKRKSFVSFTMPSDTFGLQAVSGGLLTFGSIATPGAFPVSIGTVQVNYQRLQHPNGTTAMSSVVSSTVFDGLAFVIAEFTDGKRYPYYNGSLVTDFTDILRLAHLSTNALFAAHIAGVINAKATGFTATQQANPNDFKVDIQGAAGTDFEVSVSEETVGNGTLSVATTVNPINGSDETLAVGSFRIMAGSEAAQNVLTVKVVSPAAAETTLTNGPSAVPWNNTDEQTALDVANNIAAFSGTSGFTASAVGDRVIITPVAGQGDARNDYVVKVEAAGNVCIGNSFIELNGTGFTVFALMVNGTQLLSANWVTPDEPPVPVPSVATFRSANEALSAFVARMALDINDQYGNPPAAGGGTEYGTINSGAGTTAHGYIAFASGNRLQISKKITRSDDLEEAVACYIKPTQDNSGGGNGGNDGEPPQLFKAVVPSNVSAIYTPSGSRPSGRTATDIVACQAENGVLPFTFLWKAATTGSASKITIGATTSFETFFYVSNTVLYDAGTITGTFVCEVTDATGAKVRSNVLTVSFTKNNP